MARKPEADAPPAPPPNMGEEEFPEAPVEGAAVGAQEEDLDIDPNVGAVEEAAVEPPPPPPPTRKPRARRPADPAPTVDPPNPRGPTERETELERQNALLAGELDEVKRRLAAAEKRARGKGGLMEFTNHTPETARAARAAKAGRPGQFHTLRHIKQGAREHSRRQNRMTKDVAKAVKALAGIAGSAD